MQLERQWKQNLERPFTLQVLRSVISESIKIHQTEWFLFLLFSQEMMNAKKILAKMPGELRSPLLGIVSMVERFSSITKLDEEQRRLLIKMILSAGLALERINAFLELFQVVSGRKKLTWSVIFITRENKRLLFFYFYFIFEVLFIHYLIKVSK